MSIALHRGVELRDRSRSTPPNPAEVLPDAEAEVDRLLVAGATIERRGDHYRIVSSVETWDELEALAHLGAGQCICGTPLSQRFGTVYCRRCERR
jgi:hypothetical protein